MLYKADVREITREDLVTLRENQIPESHTLDYKRDFPVDREARLSLAADVVAFANTRGGDLLLGVEESGGLIREFAPITLEDRDSALLGLQSALTDLIEPKIPGIHLAAVPMDSGFIIIIRTPASFQAPHRVRKSGVFYSRTSTGIDPMDITTLRSAFLRSATASEKASAFREQRIAELRKRPLPAPLPGRTLGVLHVLPVASILGSVSFDIATLDEVARRTRPPLADGWGSRINLDGAMSASGGRDELMSYTQIFRDGSLESVMPVQFDGSQIAWLGHFEQSLEEGHHTSLTSALASLGLDGPAFVMLSFVGIGGMPLEQPNGYTTTPATVPQYYRNLLLPELFLESFTSSEPSLYGSLFDLVWNAAGRPKRRPYR
ncbi:helix-turn-helix domain-containing protein [Ralstonia pseudosolanacearum]|uniref:AlbA family DNA-binding domain-containing protein n=1 Tax=Ralstonia pseudosolanacearum TaxID=1310165 RepID=UPI00048D5139|nr:ATP-binding protein [Ralstonia pseudosolanacearum]